MAAGVVSVACMAAIMVGIVGRSADEQLHPVSVGVSWETNRYVKMSHDTFGYAWSVAL